MTLNQTAVLGKYHLLERLAADEIAEVYRVKTIGIAGFEKVQVLKRIQPRCAQDPKFIRAFIDEAKIAFSLNHRNIVQVFEFGKIDGDLFLAMEYIPGANLQELLVRAREQRRVTPVGLTCYLMGEVAAGLDYAHRKADHFGHELDIVHCDIRPRNIACSFEGSVKILDFGISRAVWLLQRARERWVCLPYVSPEQVQGRIPDARTDLFSFGVILWELLTNQPLFSGRSSQEMQQSILHKPVPNPRSINGDVPTSLDELTMRCLAREPEQRVESANDLQVELHRIQRTLGAVIGSRALSAYLDELLPGHDDTTDVRAESAADNSEPYQTFEKRPRTHDLVDAAAELALPQNPPAVPVSETSEVALLAMPLPQRRSEEIVPAAADGPLARLASQEAELAGVLRSGRHPDQEPLGPRSSQSSGVLTPYPSDEITEAPVRVAVADSAAGDPLDAFSLWVGDEEQPPPQLLPTGDDEVATSAGPANLQSEPSLTPTIIPEVVSSSAALESSVPDDPAAEMLGEKKRFIACIVMLEGSPGALEETAPLVADIAFKFDGILHAVAPGKLAVLFGLPTADENDVVTAVRFALDAQDALANWHVDAANQSTDAEVPTVTVRIGIRAGTARMGGLPTQHGYQLLGQTLQETENLARSAGAGQIFVAGLAARLCSMHYVLRSVRSFERHGKPVRSYRVLAPRSRGSQRHTEGDNPFVGREVELKALRSTWRQTVLKGSQAALLVAGEPGIGKSRLVDEFVVRHCTDAKVVAVSATPHRRGTPYALIVDVLRAITGVWSAGSLRSRARLMEALRGLLPEDQRELLKAVESLIVPRDVSAPDGAGFSLLGVHRAMRGLLNRLSASHPLIVVVENLHWADSASIECLTALVEHPQDASGATLLLMTTRPEEDQPPDMLFPSQLTSFLLLEELDDADRARLIQDELRERGSDTLVREVTVRAGGNPFYIRELARAFHELKTAGPTDVPPTIQGVVAARVDRLPAPVKSLLQHAAVIGPTFREGVLAALINHNPARPLSVLRSRGLIVPGLRTAVPETTNSGKSEQFEREWVFRHVLIQQVVYEAINSSARRELHRRVGEIMVKRLQRGSSDPPAEVAHHLELAGDVQRAGEFYLHAANEAAGAFASREALALYDHALRLSDGLPERQYAVHAGRERVYAQLGLHHEQAAALEALGRLCGNEPARLADLRNRQALHLLRLGEFYRALAAAEQGESAATQAGDELAQGEALLLRGEAYERLNDHHRAINVMSKALQSFEKQRALANQVRARIALGRVHLIQARYDEAFTHFDPALRLIKETGDRWQERVLRNSLAVVHYCRGDLTRALDEAFHGLKLCEQFGDRAREGDNASVIGIVYLELGMYQLARCYLEQALLIHRETGSQWSEADTLVYLGLLEAASDRCQRALDLLEQAKAIAARIGAKYIAINASNAIAWALCERGNVADATRARDEATAAAELARATRLIVGEIPGLSRSARATALLGDLDAARALSRRAVELLEEQRIIESPEEEIYYAHYCILANLLDPAAAEYLQRAYDGYISKLERLQDAQHREAFSQQVRLNVAIQRDHAALTGDSIPDSA